MAEDLAAALKASLEEPRARRRQRALDNLRKAALTSASAAKLLERVDPDGTLQFEDSEASDAVE